MSVDSDSLGRIAKLFIDRDDASLEEATAALANFRVILRCGPEVSSSPTLQAAVLTAANIARRCFPAGLRLQGVQDGPIYVPWPAGRTFPDAIVDVAGDACLEPLDSTWDYAISIAFGTVEDCRNVLQTAFDGWTCAVSPFREKVNLPQRERCILTGVALGSLAVSEVFLGNFGFAIEAGSRLVGLSLWRPDLPWDAADAVGAEASLLHLPNELWLLGLGHLGQAFAWALSLLPFSQPSDVNIMLQDYDRVVRANLDTGLLSHERDIGSLKTRVTNNFMEDRGLRPRLVERRFDAHTHPQREEPRVVLAGMDGKGPRHLLDQVGFDLIIDCGVGGTIANFDSITMNVLPNSHITAAELWPASDEQSVARRENDTKRLASSRAVYKSVLERQGCGHVELAGRSAAVPFVGAMSSAFALSEMVRRLIGATTFDRIHLQLASPGELAATCSSKPARPRMPSQKARLQM
jgi:hypothetical protein